MPTKNDELTAAREIAAKAMGGNDARTLKKALAAMLAATAGAA